MSGRQASLPFVPLAPVVAHALDGLVTPEEFVVFVVAAITAAELGVVCDELNTLEPLHMPEAVLQFITQAQRCPVTVAHRFAVHVVGQHGQMVAHLLDRVRDVVDSAVGAGCE
jgi:hypothetical protein